MSIENAVERIHRLVTTRADAFKNEDAIKASLVMPFLAGLGSDPTDPDHVVAGYRDGQTKVDFATIDEDGAPHILVCVTSTPEEVDTPRAKALATLLAEAGDVGLLTNGHVYRFHGLGANRAMLAEPFMAFNLQDGPIEASILEPLTREGYDLEAAVAAGRMTKLPVVAYDTLLAQLAEGSSIHDVIATAIVPGGIATDASRAAATEALARALRVLSGEEPALPPEPAPEDGEEGRVISGDEQAAFQAVRRIASRYVEGNRIHARPALAYLAVLLDDNNRRTVCRLYFSASSTRYIGTFVGRDEDKQRISGFNDVENFEAQIEARLRELDPGAFAVRDAEPRRDKSTDQDEVTAQQVDGQQVNEQQAEALVPEDLSVDADGATPEAGAAEEPVESIVTEGSEQQAPQADLIGGEESWRDQ